jgi:hypothetical protein
MSLWWLFLWYFSWISLQVLSSRLTFSSSKCQFLKQNIVYSTFWQIWYEILSQRIEIWIIIHSVSDNNCNFVNLQWLNLFHKEWRILLSLHLMLVTLHGRLKLGPIHTRLQVLRRSSLRVKSCNLNHWEHGSWDLALHVGSQIPSPSYDMDVYMTTLSGGEARDLCWELGRAKNYTKHLTQVPQILLYKRINNQL